MNTDDKLDHVSDTIAFLLARVKGDPEMAMEIVGGDTRNISVLLMGMTDLCMGMVVTFAAMTHCTPEEFVRTMAMGAKFHGDEFLRGK